MSAHGLWRVGVIGATGAVGRTMLACLAEAGIGVGELRAFASQRSAGTRLTVPGGADGSKEREVVVEPVARERLADLDLVLLSAGAEPARAWVPFLRERGIWAVDNSSAYRRDPEVPLIVPEVNDDRIPARPSAIANPNCSTIQMVVALAPIHRAFGLCRVHVATYQSVSGRGQKGIAALRDERAGRDPGPHAFPHPIDGNVLPQCDVFLPDGWTREEDKMIFETRRILELPGLPVHPTCVRVPVEVAHSEVVHVACDRPMDVDSLRTCLASAAGIEVLDDPARERYPTARHAAGTNQVWVGRIRVDREDPTQALLWIVSDNLRKGAAWNAVQIAARLPHPRSVDANVPTAP